MAVPNPILNELLQGLTPEEEQRVVDFIRQLRQARQRPAQRVPRLDWAGALSDLRDRYTSVELQHEISRIRLGPQ